MNLNDFDTVCVGLSGGKDSTATFLWALYESGIERSKIEAFFCDTGNEDALTYAFIDYLATLHPITVVKPTRKPSISPKRLGALKDGGHYIADDEPYGFVELARMKGSFPSSRRRFCTQWLKTVPSRDYIASKDGTVVILSGVRRSEGHITNNRGELSQFHANLEWGCHVYMPLYHADIEEVWRLHRTYLDVGVVTAIVNSDTALLAAHKEQLVKNIEAHGVPANPLYAAGAKRVGCFWCINSVKREVQLGAALRPQMVDNLRSLERELGSTFFPVNKVPARLCSKTVVNKRGEERSVPTVDDAVRWANLPTYVGNYRTIEEAEAGIERDACLIEGLCE